MSVLLPRPAHFKSHYSGTMTIYKRHQADYCLVSLICIFCHNTSIFQRSRDRPTSILGGTRPHYVEIRCLEDGRGFEACVRGSGW